MKYEFFIARRYLFSKKSHNAINIISTISACGVAIGAMALVCTLSVFNGFHDLVASLFTAFDPDLKVTLAEGRTIDADDAKLKALQHRSDVAVCTPCLEDQALVVQNGRQFVVTIKGVDDNFSEQVQLDQLMYPKPEDGLKLHADVLEYGVLGIQLCAKLGLQAFFENPLTVYAPKRGERVNMGNPMSSFNQDELNSPGMVFQVRQAKYDANYIITSLGFAQRLFDHPGEVTQVELKMKPGTNISRAKADMQSQLGKRFKVLDRYEQQQETFNIMSIEKFIAYLFLTFILMVASFNIIGSLSMLMIDKKRDVQTLRNLGATNTQISHIFMLEGGLISTLGAVIGIAIGVGLCWAQQTYGFIPMGETESTFIVNSYPVSVHYADVGLVFITVLVVSWLSIYFPVRYLCKNII